MGQVRLRLHLVALITVILQIATPTFASAMLCCKDPAALAGHTDDLMECCKKGSMHICPLRSSHSKSQGSQHDHSANLTSEDADTHGDTLRPMCQPDYRIFQALLGTTALLPAVRPMTAPPSIELERLQTSDRPLWMSTAGLPPPKA